MQQQSSLTIQTPATANSPLVYEDIRIYFPDLDMATHLPLPPSPSSPPLQQYPIYDRPSMPNRSWGFILLLSIDILAYVGLFTFYLHFALHAPISWIIVNMDVFLINFIRILILCVYFYSYYYTPQCKEFTVSRCSSCPYIKPTSVCFASAIYASGKFFSIYLSNYFTISLLNTNVLLVTKFTLFTASYSILLPTLVGLIFLFAPQEQMRQTQSDSTLGRYHRYSSFSSSLHSSNILPNSSTNPHSALSSESTPLLSDYNRTKQHTLSHSKIHALPTATFAPSSARPFIDEHDSIHHDYRMFLGAPPPTAPLVPNSPFQSYMPSKPFPNRVNRVSSLPVTPNCNSSDHSHKFFKSSNSQHRFSPYHIPNVHSLPILTDSDVLPRSRAMSYSTNMFPNQYIMSLLDTQPSKYTVNWPASTKMHTRASLLQTMPGHWAAAQNHPDFLAQENNSDAYSVGSEFQISQHPQYIAHNQDLHRLPIQAELGFPSPNVIPNMNQNGTQQKLYSPAHLFQLYQKEQNASPESTSDLLAEDGIGSGTPRSDQQTGSYSATPIASPYPAPNNHTLMDSQYQYPTKPGSTDPYSLTSIDHSGLKDDSATTHLSNLSHHLYGTVDIQIDHHLMYRANTPSPTFSVDTPGQQHSSSSVSNFMLASPLPLPRLTFSKPDLQNNSSVLNSHKGYTSVPADSHASAVSAFQKISQSLKQIFYGAEASLWQALQEMHSDLDHNNSTAKAKMEHGKNSNINEFVTQLVIVSKEAKRLLSNSKVDPISTFTLHILIAACQFYFAAVYTRSADKHWAYSDKVLMHANTLTLGKRDAEMLVKGWQALASVLRDIPIADTEIEEWRVDPMWQFRYKLIQFLRLGVV